MWIVKDAWKFSAFTNRGLSSHQLVLQSLFPHPISSINKTYWVLNGFKDLVLGCDFIYFLSIRLLLIFSQLNRIWAVQPKLNSWHKKTSELFNQTFIANQHTLIWCTYFVPTKTFWNIWKQWQYSSGVYKRLEFSGENNTIILIFLLFGIRIRRKDRRCVRPGLWM